MRKFLDILVLSYNNFDSTTKLALNSLLCQGKSDTRRVTVVDNNSMDGSFEKLKNYKSVTGEYRSIFLKENAGFAGGMNLGAETCDAEWLMLVNSDTIFPNRCLDRFEEILKKIPADVGLVGPLTNAAGTAQNLPIFGPSKAILAIGDLFQSNPIDHLIPMTRLDFFCVAIRRSLWDSLGGLDESFKRGYYEDIDFSVRARVAGAGIVMTEDVFVYHKGSATFKHTEETIRLIRENKRLFQRKHPFERLTHQRDDNMYVLRKYLDRFNQGEVSTGMTLRLSFRLTALSLGQPRGILKRIRWEHSVAAIYSDIKSVMKCELEERQSIKS